MPANIDGGPAFPTPAVYRADGIALDYGANGMTKREYIAIAAMQGELASCPPDANWRPVELAERAVAIADAMLEALIND